MNSQQSFQRFAAVTAIISFPLALASDVLLVYVPNFSTDVAAVPSLMLSAGADGANLLRWGMILDMLSYYLPLLQWIYVVKGYSPTKFANDIFFYGYETLSVAR